MSDYLIKMLEKLINNTIDWQQFWLQPNFNNELFVDTMINSPTHIWRPSYWLQDGRFISHESLTCAQVEPPHIHFYRGLAFQMLFPGIERNTVQLYTNGIVGTLKINIILCFIFMRVNGCEWVCMLFCWIRNTAGCEK